MKGNIFLKDESGGIILDYRVIAKQMLCQYKSIKCAVNNISIRINELRDMLLALENPVLKERVQGGLMEDKTLSILCEIDRLERILDLRKKDIERMDNALAVLSEEQSRILWEFYIENNGGHVERLMQELSLERRTVYYRHDAALKAFTLAMFGLCDI